MLFTEVKLENSDSDVGVMSIGRPQVAPRDAAGYFYLAGHVQRMFLNGGVNVDRAEIESGLVSHKATRTFVSLDALPRRPYGEVVKETLRKALA